MRPIRRILGAAVVAAVWSTGAQAQTNSLNSFGGFTPTPVGGGPSAYVVGPALPGSGGTYSYAQQPSGLPGGSPNAYYSMNYFTNTPMSRPYGYGPAAYNPAAYNSAYRGYAAPATAGVPYAPNAPMARTYTTTNGAYATANRTYYANEAGAGVVPTRRGGPLRRLFGR